MAEKHEKMVAQYRVRLVRQKYKIEKGSPFADYRPDVFATKQREKLVVEVEIESTLETDHTLRQLGIMYKYLRANKFSCGILVVPKRTQREATFMIESIFGDNKIKVVGL